MIINQVIGMSHGTQEPMESGRYHDIIIVTSASCIIYFAFTKMADSQKLLAKTLLLPSIYTFFGLIFSKAINLY